MNVKRGEVYYADMPTPKGSEQGGKRPVLILQNDVGNKYSTTTIVAPITSRFRKLVQPTHIRVKVKCLPKKSIVLLEQITTIDKNRLINKMGQLSKKQMEKMEAGMLVSLGIRKGEI